MKNTKHFGFYLFAAFAISISLLVSCEPDEPRNECCVGFDVLTKSYDTYMYITENDSVQFKGDLKFYTGLTPKNYNFCDSLVESSPGVYIFPYNLDPELLCSPEEALAKYQDGCRSCCPCRKNPDTVYNDIITTYNDAFIIDGVENFEYNKLIIRIPNDTSKVKEFFNYDNKNIFGGHITVDSTLYGRNPINKMLKSGRYEFEFIIYADKSYTLPFDTIRNSFCIIRTPDDVDKNCVGKDDGDPLLDNK